RRIKNPFLSHTVARISLWPIWILFFYFILQAAGLSGLATGIIGGTGVLGIVLGLAFKGIAENYLAGLLLAARAPFTKGDLIILDQYKGYVQNLNMRGTTIIDLSGHLILIPNSTVINSIVENQTANPKIRTEFTISITYADSISKAQELLIEAMRTVRGTLPDPSPDVLVESFESSGVTLRIRSWFNVKDTNEPRFRSRTMAVAKETLLANGFTIPSDIKEIVFSDALKVRLLETKEEVASASQEKKDKIIEQAATNLQASQNRPQPTADTQADDLMKLAEDNPLMKSFTGDPKTKF
ncbi:MAG: mechanosensitive ion channel, partial [Proteobacteria bacterium]